MNLTRWHSDPIRQTLSAVLIVLVLGGTVYTLWEVGREEDRLTIATKQGVEGVALKEISHRFSQLTHRPVEVVELPYDDLYEEEERQLVNRPHRGRDTTPPFDVIMVDDPWLYGFVSSPDDKQLRLTDLTGIVRRHEEKFFKKTLEVATYCPAGDPCDHYFAVPFVANSQLFAYSASAFAKAPSSWQEVSDASRKQQDGIGYVARIGPGNSIVTDFMPILWADDPESFAERVSGPPFHNPESAFTILKTLVGSHKNLGDASFDDFDVSAYLQKGRASTGIVWSAWAMMLADTESAARQPTRQDSAITSPSTLKLHGDLCTSADPEVQLANDSRNRSEERLVFSPMPKGHSGTNQPELGVWLLAIPSNSDNPEPALHFIKFAIDILDERGTSDKQSLVAAHLGTPPSRISALEKLSQESRYRNVHPSLIPQIYCSLRQARHRPRTPCWKEIESIVGAHLQEIINETPDSTCTTENCNCTPNGRVVRFRSVRACSDLTKETNRQLESLFTERGCRDFRESLEQKLQND